MTKTLDEAKLLHVTEREEWRDWLKKYHKSEKEVWLVFYKKHTGKPRISYNDSVEEALCFGWIDSTVRRIDEDRFAQRFSVRNPKTPYSQSNQERLRKLIEQGKVTRPVKGATLIGNGPEAMTRVSMVGDDLKLDAGVGVCGKEGQSVPVGVGQPTLKVDELTVGGTGQ